MHNPKKKKRLMQVQVKREASKKEARRKAKESRRRRWKKAKKRKEVKARSKNRQNPLLKFLIYLNLTSEWVKS